MPTRLDGHLTLGTVVAYTGPETDWTPRVALLQTTPREGLERLDVPHDPAHCFRTFDSVGDAVRWARAHHYDGVLLPLQYLPNVFHY